MSMHFIQEVINETLIHKGAATYRSCYCQYPIQSDQRSMIHVCEATAASGRTEVSVSSELVALGLIMFAKVGCLDLCSDS